MFLFQRDVWSQGENVDLFLVSCSFYCVTQYNCLLLFSLSLEKMALCFLLDQIVFVSKCKIITNISVFWLTFTLKWTQLQENFGCAVTQL